MTAYAADILGLVTMGVGVLAHFLGDMSAGSALAIIVATGLTYGKHPDD
jgi:hypothetical protein